MPLFDSLIVIINYQLLLVTICFCWFRHRISSKCGTASLFKVSAYCCLLGFIQSCQVRQEILCQGLTSTIFIKNFIYKQSLCT